MLGTIVKFGLLFLIFAALLGFGISRAGLAAAFSDPISGIRTQDETTYATSAVSLATRGDWLTPKVLGRYYLVKPPLLIWLSGISVKLFGISRFALRLPVLLAAIVAAVLLFLWAETAYSRGAAILTALFLVANPLWHTFSRVCYTDMLLVLAMIAAFFSLRRDPGLSTWRGGIVFGIAAAVGIMAKNVAGLLPVLVVLIASVLTRTRIPIGALLRVLAVAALLILPWHVYQLLSHFEWFLADYVGFSLLQSGLSPPAQSSPEPHGIFYLKRLWLTDPLLCLAAALAIPFLAASVRRRKSEAALLAAWLLVTVAALFAFRFRNLPYLLYAIPPLCLIAAAYGPLSSGRRQRAAIAVLMAAFCFKAIRGGEPWGLSFGAAPPIAAAKSLRAYARLQRPGELIVVAPDDEFYAAALPVPRVRYCFIDPAASPPPHYAYLGITVSAAQFAEMDRWEPRFRKRLKEWKLDSSDPIATAIVAHSHDEVVKLVTAYPHSDFYLPADLQAAVGPAVEHTHQVVPVSPDRLFLLALQIPEHKRLPAPRWQPSSRW
jgi:4-amino-4-deoxy-L-arabinose transferase-like glycosyltransferase